jgi:hypothetical protein
MKKIILAASVLFSLILTSQTASAASLLRMSGEAARLERANITSGVPARLVAHAGIYLRSKDGETCLPKTGAITVLLSRRGAAASEVVATENASYLLKAALDTATCTLANSSVEGYMLKPNQLVSGVLVASFNATTLADGQYYAEIRLANTFTPNFLHLGGLRTNSLNIGSGTVVTPPVTDPAVASISVTNPNGGETLVKGQAYTIRWDANVPTGQLYNYNLWLERGGVQVGTAVIGSVVSPLNSLSWTPSTLLDDGSNYKIKISMRLNNGTTEIIDRSNGTFTIASTAPSPNPTVASIALTNPNGDETIITGQPYTIRWDAVIPTGQLYNYNLWLERAGEVVGSVLGSAVSPATSFSWTPSTALADGSNYKIKIKMALNNGSTEIIDRSNSTFTIAPSTSNPVPPPATAASVSITAPNGGETLVKGQSYTIRWDAGVPAGQLYNYNLWLERNGEPVGNTVIGSAVSPATSLNWTPAATLQSGAGYKIKIKMRLNNGTTEIVDRSNINFSITDAPVQPSAVTATWNDNGVHPISHVTDNNTSTYYLACATKNTKYNNGVLTYDLGSVRTISNIAIDFNQSVSAPGAVPSQYRVEASTDRMSWTTLSNIYPAVIGGPDVNLSPTQASGRYVRLNYSKVGDSTGSCAAINEFKVTSS